jgi:hypothetical protein
MQIIFQKNIPFVYNSQNYSMFCRAVYLPNSNPKQIYLGLRLPNSGSDLVILILESLEGNPKSKTITDVYSSRDYFQQTFENSSSIKGLGASIHDFLIQHKLLFPFTIDNVYSTNQILDKLYISEKLFFTNSANNFWSRRLALNKASWDNVLGRYSIIW